MKPIYLDGASNIPKKRKMKRRPANRPLNAKEKRHLKVFQFDKSTLKYESFIPLHQLWQGYMKALYDHRQSPEQFAHKILKADFHGSIMTVTKSINPGFIGTTGIIIQETLNIFTFITKDNGVKKVPKSGSIFLLTTDACESTFTLYGKQLQFRAAERAVKKFKVKPTIDL
ncbi:Rof/RNase P-like protein [Cunninghamella echinulata]|nr:Rof/RNase P-like protein [Cunninghamella echinulata]